MMTHELTQWYLKYKGDSCYQTQFLDEYNKPKCNKPLVLLVGKNKIEKNDHQFYLWRFKRNWVSRDEILNLIKTKRLWNASITNQKTFEELYIFVGKQLKFPQISQIGQLIIYDIAIHLAYINGGTPMPKDKVYIHALPLRAWYNLKKNGIIKDIPLIDGKAKYDSLSSYFPGLSATQIEDLLCDLGKSIRRKKKKRPSNGSIEQEIDDIVNRYIHTIVYF